MASPDTALEGTLEKIVFQNADSHFMVARLRQADGATVTIVGALAAVAPGTELRVTGKWVVDARFGEQFRVDSFATKSPETLAGIEKFLGSGLIYGIGPELARRLVETFGHETLAVIGDKPNRLVEVPGIGLARATRIHEAYKTQRGVEDVIVFLRGHGLSASASARVIKRYGANTINVVRDNPYRLAVEVWGIGFMTADAIAKKLGLAADAPARLEAGLVHVLTTRLDDGHIYTPRVDALASAGQLLLVAEELLSAALDRLVHAKLVVSERLDEHGNCVGLVAWVELERRAASLLRQIIDTPGRAAHIDPATVGSNLANHFGFELAAEQNEAVTAALTEKCTVITGGPGVGKTTIVRGVLQLAKAGRRRVALCAPTGRAAKRLTETTGQEASTLHRLLEFTPQTGEFGRNTERQLELDVLICDEASMLDLPLFVALLGALPPQAQLVLVGDIDQLPSVGAGAVLADVIASDAARVVRLKRIFRQAQQSRIVRNAHHINLGESPELDAEEGSDFFFIQRDEPEAARDTIVDLVAERIPAKFGFRPLTDVQVLTPMHRGPLGTIALGEALQARLNPSAGRGAEWQRGNRTFRPGDKVMQLRNDYQLGIYNGDAGIITALDSDRMIIDFDGRLVELARDDADQLTLAYAISIHKSQGSEYPAVVVVCSTQHFVMLGRNLLYTAVTRGKQLVVLVGSRRAVSLAVRNSDAKQRLTWLAQRLRAD